MTPDSDPTLVRLALPKGRIQQGVLDLLADAGVGVQLQRRGLRPCLSVRGFEAKVLKPQNIARMLASGSRELGFAGADWTAELDLDLVELLDTGLDPVQIVAAAPPDLLVDGKLPRRRLVVATEYPRLTERWIADRGMDATIVRSYGATEVFPPEDADLIVDNSSSGETLEAHGLVVCDVLMESSTRLYANRSALAASGKREIIEGLAMLVRSVLDARKRVMIEVNVPEAQLENVVQVLPGMGQPTIAPLHASTGFGVKAAVLRAELPRLIPRIKACGGTDIVVSALAQIVL